MSKRYRLKIDVGYVKVGAEAHLKQYDEHYWFENQDGKMVWFPQSFVENNPSIFEEIKEPERIKVKRLQFIGGQIEPGYWNYSLYINTPEIHVDKYDKIKQVIEALLNNDKYNNDLKDAHKWTQAPYTDSPNLYTQSYINKVREETWLAAKSNKPDPSGLPQLVYTYPTFESYLNSLKK